MCLATVKVGWEGCLCFAAVISSSATSIRRIHWPKRLAIPGPRRPSMLSSAFDVLLFFRFMFLRWFKRLFSTEGRGLQPAARGQGGGRRHDLDGAKAAGCYLRPRKRPRPTEGTERRHAGRKAGTGTDDDVVENANGEQAADLPESLGAFNVLHARRCLPREVRA